MKRYTLNRRKQKGAALITALVILSVITIIGAYVFSGTALQEKMASNSELLSVTRGAAQSAVDAFVSNGIFVAGGTLADGSNIGRNVVRRTISVNDSPPRPFTPLAANALTACVATDGTLDSITEGSINVSCAGTQFQSAAGTVVRSRMEAYFVGCVACPGSSTTEKCPTFYIRGTGWLDADANGFPPANGAANADEAQVYVDEWMRWTKPVKCSW